MIHQDEQEKRLKALKEYNILDTIPEEIYDNITQIASSICNMPVAMISLLDKERQFFKSRIGIDISETPIEQAVCYEAILSEEEIFEVPDLRIDDRFKKFSLVTDDPHLVSYFGVPLLNPQGIAFGTLCVVSKDEVKTISQEQKNTLKKLAKQIIYILELRKKQEELAIYHEKVEKYAQEMEVFAFTAAHDLRSPLRTISSFLKMIEGKNSQTSDEKEKVYFKFIFDSVKRMDKLIVDLLDYAKSNKKLIDKESININQLVSDVFESLIHDNNSLKPILVTNNLPEITTSKIAINMIFHNLIDNALKYQKKDNIAQITINYIETPQQHTFEIIDNGIGINQEYLDLVFQPFKRLHTQAEYLGSGLGLASVKKMVESINGEISVSSIVDKGSIFTFSIPK
ncbi:ATP-binding protein [Flavobacterium sp. HXWNR29]|uniref:sensor histidine kinase n=1 Tax=Flavobacterium odoriferum TaxID=2946604 RepID=UPI0021CB8CAC|nr:ATP-binding protein [Flavobacterium sp. HXWNR29]MCU4189509.1 ATP-binding protein [Flavobacterium sp. HXWNR29]